MTVVIALKTRKSFLLGSDSFCGDDRVAFMCGPKFHRHNDVIWGLCGFTLYENALIDAQIQVTATEPLAQALETLQILRGILEERNLMPEVDGFKEMKDSTFFFIADGRMYYVESDLSYWESIDGRLAIGCGKYYSLGALHAAPSNDPHLSMNLALEAAAYYSPHVRAPFHVEEYFFDDLE